MLMLIAVATLVTVGVVNLVVAVGSFFVSRPFARRRHEMALVPTMPGVSPFVSVHLAIYDEPAHVVIATLKSLARSDHHAFEVLVIDNNTPDPATWRAVRECVDQLGPRFRFFHFDGVEGAKAGALNIALGLADPRTRYVAVVDADYQVTPDFLSVAAAVCGPSVQFVQFPQAYRGAHGADAVVAELADYFETFPRAANRAQASLLTGTLSMISIDALRGVGGWPTQSITEDAQLGLTLWAAGARGLYIDREAGHGLLPMNLEGLRMQRRRWVTGNFQTLISGTSAILRTRPGALAVVAQLTAWLGLLAIPLLTLVAVAIFRAWSPYGAMEEWGLRMSEAVAVATFGCVLGGYVVRAVVGRRFRSLAVTFAMIWSSSFAWLTVLGIRPPRFRRTPKTVSARAGGVPVDAIASIVALVTAAAFVAEGSPITAATLAVSAAGLFTAPFVDRSLRRAASRELVPSAA